MSVSKYSPLDLIAHTLRALEENKKALENCCNHMMKCRQERYDEVVNLIKVNKFLFLREQMRIAFTQPGYVFYFDLDNVIFDWRKAILEELPDFKDIDEFNKFEGRDELIKEVYEKQPDWFLHLPWMNEAADRIRVLQEAGIRVEYLTATGDFDGKHEMHATCKQAALNEYLGFHGLEIPDDSEFHAVRHSEDKAAYITPKAVLFDDYHRNINFWRKGGGIGVLVDTETYEEAQAWDIFDGCVTQQIKDLKCHTGGE
jgi:hypothetical protein